ncbi:MAG: hypothetical protein ACYDFR_04680, partial [Candidatus Omnitrophota bacterium]
ERQQGVDGLLRHLPHLQGAFSRMVAGKYLEVKDYNGWKHDELLGQFYHRGNSNPKTIRELLRDLPEYLPGLSGIAREVRSLIAVACHIRELSWPGIELAFLLAKEKGISTIAEAKSIRLAIEKIGFVNAEIFKVIKSAALNPEQGKLLNSLLDCVDKNKYSVEQATIVISSAEMVLDSVQKMGILISAVERGYPVDEIETLGLHLADENDKKALKTISKAIEGGMNIQEATKSNSFKLSASPLFIRGQPYHKSSSSLGLNRNGPDLNDLTMLSETEGKITSFLCFIGSRKYQEFESNDLLRIESFLEHPAIDKDIKLFIAYYWPGFLSSVNADRNDLRNIKERLEGLASNFPGRIKLIPSKTKIDCWSQDSCFVFENKIIGFSNDSNKIRAFGCSFGNFHNAAVFQHKAWRKNGFQVFTLEEMDYYPYFGMPGPYDIITGSGFVFVHSASLPYTARKSALEGFLSRISSQKIVFVNPVMDSECALHLDVFFTSLGGNKVAVAEKEYSADIENILGREFAGLNIENRRRTNFDWAAVDLTRTGFDVLRLPFVPSYWPPTRENTPLITYNNVHVERYDGINRVYMPVYAPDFWVKGASFECNRKMIREIEVLDALAEDVYVKAGFEVIKLRGFAQIAEGEGSLHCSFKALERLKSDHRGSSSVIDELINNLRVNLKHLRASIKEERPEIKVFEKVSLDDLETLVAAIFELSKNDTKMVEWYLYAIERYFSIMGELVDYELRNWHNNDQVRGSEKYIITTIIIEPSIIIFLERLARYHKEVYAFREAIDFIDSIGNYELNLRHEEWAPGEACYWPRSPFYSVDGVMTHNSACYCVMHIRVQKRNIQNVRHIWPVAGKDFNYDFIKGDSSRDFPEYEKEYLRQLEEAGMPSERSKQFILPLLRELFGEEKVCLEQSLSFAMGLIKSGIPPCATLEIGVPLAYTQAKDDPYLSFDMNFEQNIRFLKKITLRWQEWLKTDNAKLFQKMGSRAKAAVLNAYLKALMNAFAGRHLYEMEEPLDNFFKILSVEELPVGKLFVNMDKAIESALVFESSSPLLLLSGSLRQRKLQVKSWQLPIPKALFSVSFDPRDNDAKRRARALRLFTVAVIKTKVLRAIQNEKAGKISILELEEIFRRLKDISWFDKIFTLYSRHMEWLDFESMIYFESRRKELSYSIIHRFRERENLAGAGRIDRIMPLRPREAILYIEFKFRVLLKEVKAALAGGNQLLVYSLAKRIMSLPSQYIPTPEGQVEACVFLANYIKRAKAELSALGINGVRSSSSLVDIKSKEELFALLETWEIRANIKRMLKYFFDRIFLTPENDDYVRLGTYLMVYIETHSLWDDTNTARAFLEIPLLKELLKGALVSSELAHNTYSHFMDNLYSIDPGETVRLFDTAISCYKEHEKIELPVLGVKIPDYTLDSLCGGLLLSRDKNFAQDFINNISPFNLKEIVLRLKNFFPHKSAQAEHYRGPAAGYLLWFMRKSKERLDLFFADDEALLDSYDYFDLGGVIDTRSAEKMIQNAVLRTLPQTGNLIDRLIKNGILTQSIDVTFKEGMFAIEYLLMNFEVYYSKLEKLSQAEQRVLLLLIDKVLPFVFYYLRNKKGTDAQYFKLLQSIQTYVFVKGQRSKYNRTVKGKIKVVLDPEELKSLNLEPGTIVVVKDYPSDYLSTAVPEAVIIAQKGLARSHAYQKAKYANIPLYYCGNFGHYYFLPLDGKYVEITGDKIKLLENYTELHLRSPPKTEIKVNIPGADVNYESIDLLAKAQVKRHGYKAYHLGILESLGINVPSGVLLPFGICINLISGNALIISQIGSYINRLNKASDRAEIALLCREIREIISGITIPEEIIKNIIYRL